MGAARGSFMSAAPAGVGRRVQARVVPKVGFEPTRGCPQRCLRALADVRERALPFALRAG
jgi:hypothetical protein